MKLKNVLSAGKRSLLLPLMIVLWTLIKIGFLTQKLIVSPFLLLKFILNNTHSIPLPKHLPKLKLRRDASSGQVVFNNSSKSKVQIGLDIKKIHSFLANIKNRFHLPKISLPKLKPVIKTEVTFNKTPKSTIIYTQKVYSEPNPVLRFISNLSLRILSALWRWTKWALFSLAFVLILFITGLLLRLSRIIYALLYFFLISTPLTLWNFIAFLPRFIFKKRYRQSFRVRFSTAFLVGFVLLLGLLAVYSFYLVRLTSQLPSPTRLSDMNGPLTTTFYDRNGKVLYRLYDDKNRSLVKLSDLPPYLVEATIATEDKNFYTHQGVDFEAIARAGWLYMHNQEVTGGSTITQQLIKNTLLTPERTIDRKTKEIILAFWTERLYSKDQILQMYFNEVPYGGQAWGIAAASETYFGKNPQDLDLAESAYLAGLTSSPTTYSPYGPNPMYGKERQQEVLRRMVEAKDITPVQSQSALAENLDIKPPVTEINAPHFVMYLKQKLEDEYGAKYVAEGGLQVYTSLDLNVQKMAEQVVKEQVDQLAPLDVTNGAAMITDSTNGQILAMVGSKDYWDPNNGAFNVATANRQPGSSIKPVTYATAFKEGLTPGTVILDAPVSYSNAWETYAPVNYDGKFHGPVTIRTSLGSSYNIPAVKTLNFVGIPNMISTAKDMGITTFTDPSRYGLSLTLGGGEVKLIDMMAAYGTLSQLGVRHDPQPVLKIVDSAGQVIEDDTQSSTGTQALPSGVAYMLTDILADNKARTPAFGPTSALVIPNHTVAVKTGTTDDKRDNWTFGYTPQYVVGVWVGNDDNHPMNPALTSGVTGAAPIWHSLMVNLLAGKSDVAFAKPANVTTGMVDGNKDLVLTNQTPRSLGEQLKPSPNNNLSLNKNNGTFLNIVNAAGSNP